LGFSVRLNPENLKQIMGGGKGEERGRFTCAWQRGLSPPGLCLCPRTTLKRGLEDGLEDSRDFRTRVLDLRTRGTCGTLGVDFGRETSGD